MRLCWRHIRTGSSATIGSALRRAASDASQPPPSASPQRCLMLQQKAVPERRVAVIPADIRLWEDVARELCRLVLRRNCAYDPASPSPPPSVNRTMQIYSLAIASAALVSRQLCCAAAIWPLCSGVVTSSDENDALAILVLWFLRWLGGFAVDVSQVIVWDRQRSKKIFAASHDCIR